MIKIERFKSSILITIEGNLQSSKPVLMMFDMNLILDPRIHMNHGNAVNGTLNKRLLIGYGSITVIGNVCAVLDAIHEMVHESLASKHTILIYLSHDHERFSYSSQKILKTYLHQNEIHLDTILETSGFVAEKGELGLMKDVGMIGITRRHSWIALYKQDSRSTSEKIEFSMSDFLFRFVVCSFLGFAAFFCLFLCRFLFVFFSVMF